jgi:hypothetical protein
MDNDKFILEDLEFYLPTSFKGLTKKYMLDCIFNEGIQKGWYPREGDVIVGYTGNIFTVSAKHTLIENLGGTLFFFGGGLCNRDGGCTLNETYSYKMNKSGKWIQHTLGGYEEVNNLYHSAFSDFRYVPYPHEL